MADTKISDLVALTTLASDDDIPIVDTSALTTKRVTVGTLDGRYLVESDVAAKGDIYVATANDAVAVLAVGANDQVLTADSVAATGVKWATPAAAPTVTFVNHGASAGTARPTGFDMVIWYGSVQPTNIVAPDVVIRTDEAV